MILLNGIISGIVATIFFDLFQIAVLFAYGGKKSNWALIGRYFIGVARMQFVQNNLINSIQGTFFQIFNGFGGSLL